ncbi:hypothetical protein KY285_010770 [Solanum tuberosum]|nr:hypothetical protein KY289_011346 [Solanum tuberosum]KAH0735063.1 hypothetical protein KY285_010770 [Solanum tuberosum]
MVSLERLGAAIEFVQSKGKGDDYPEPFLPPLLSNPRSNLRSPGAMKWGSFLRLSYVSAWLRPEPRRHSGGRMRVGRPTTT